MNRIFFFKGVIAMLLAITPFCAKAQLKQHNLWPIGNMGYVMNLNQYPPQFHKLPVYSDSGPKGYMHTPQAMLCDSSGTFFLSVKTGYDFNSCNDKLINRYYDTTQYFPKIGNCSWLTFLLQMPGFTNASGARSNAFLMNFTGDSAQYRDTTNFNFGYTYGGSIHRIIYAPDCSKILIYHRGANKISGFPATLYFDIVEVEDGKIKRRKKQSFQTIDYGRYNCTSFSPELNQCVLSYAARTFGIFKYNAASMEIDPSPVITFNNTYFKSTYSLNGRKLYFIQGDSVMQTDVTVLHADSIRNKTNCIAKLPFKVYDSLINTIQLLPTGQILLVFNNKKYPDIIQDPNQTGKECQYVFNAFHIPWDSIDYNASQGTPIDSLFSWFKTYWLQIPHYYEIPEGAYYNPGLSVVQNKITCPGVAQSIKADYYRSFIKLRWKITGPKGQLLALADQDSLRFAPTDTGTYTTTLYYRWSCNLLDSAVSTFKVNELKTPPAQKDSVLCQGQQFWVKINPALGQLKTNWFLNDRFITTADSVSISQTGHYRIQLVYPCTIWEDTFYAEFIQIPKPPVDPIYVICKKRNFTYINVSPPAATQVLWNTGYRGYSLLVDTPGQYWVNWINNCYDSTWRFQVREEIPGYTLLIPNAFTPNNDGKNELFYIAGLEELEEYHFIIYNGWGQKMFETFDKSQFWDGTYLNKPAPEGAYIYVIRGKSICTSASQFKGIFYLLKPR